MIWLKKSKGFRSKTSTKVFGSELTSGGTALHDTFGNNFVQANKLGAGNVGEYYDRIAINIFAIVGGNERLGCYDDVAGVPTNLASETGSNACANGFNWRTCTEFALPTATSWAAVNFSTSLNDGYYSNVAARYHKTSVTFGAFPNPISSWTISNESAFVANMKIGHS